MATTIKLKNSVTTTNTPTSLAQGEVAINITDKKVWVGNAATTPIQLLGAGGSASFGALTCTSLTNSGLTSGRVTYASTGGLLTDSANLTFNGTTLTAAAITSTGVATFSAGTVSAPAITTTGDTNTGIFFPAADTIAFTEGGVESMRIDSSGNVGIGTSSPSNPLTVRTSGTSTSVGGNIATRIESNGSGRAVTLQFSDNVANSSYISMVGSATAFGQAGTEAMRIDSSGNVGIGTSSIGTRLVVSGNVTFIGSTADVLNLRGRSSDGFGLILFSSNDGATVRGYFGSPAADTFAWYTGAFTERMRITSGGDVGIGVQNPPVKLHIAKSGGCAFRIDDTSTNYWELRNDSNLIFDRGGTERMRITSGGELLVGTTDTNPNSGNGVKINAGTGARTSVVGSADTNANFAMTVYSTSPAAYRFQVGYGGTIYATSTSITAISDATLKTNVKDLETGLTEIMALQPRRFDWINGDATNVAGFIAQEVQQVLPDLVEDYQYSDNETKLGLKMGDILPTLVKAIQEQQAMIEELKQEVALLKSK